MPFLLIALLLLGGCASPTAKVESQLNAYAKSAAAGADLTDQLTKAALESAVTSAELVESLGLVSYGRARFSQTVARSEKIFESCLDVSEIQFRNLVGELVEFSRRERQLVEVSLDGSRFSELELTGAPC